MRCTTLFLPEDFGRPVNFSRGNKPIPDGMVRRGWELMSGAGESKGVGKKRPRFSGALMGCCRRPLASREYY